MFATVAKIMARRVLVTGGTGFIGSHLARRLADMGDQVTITGRNRYAASRTFHERIRFVRADLRDEAIMVDLCRDQDVVFHVGALTSPWGTRTEFQQSNVEGTAHVVRGCMKHGVGRMIHISSSSVFFTNHDRIDTADNAPFAHPPFNEYAASKVAAEELIQRAVTSGLNAIIVRARAVFGPGDNAILPRIFLAAEKRRLRTIGSGQNVLDLTYIDNLVDALVAGIERGDAGAAFTITNGEPVLIWPMLKAACQAAGLPAPTKTISHARIDRIAKVCEAVWARLPGRPEPPVTRYGAGLLATSQTFNIDNAKQVLGYQPAVSMQEGMTRTIRHLRGLDDDHADVVVDLKLLFTGHCTNNERHVLADATHRLVPMHSMAALVEHPKHGRTLIDTGYATHFHEQTRGFPYFFYARVTPVSSTPEQAVKGQLERAGVGVKDIDRILVTHFHGDHIAGLKDFPDADIVCTAEAWHSVRNRGPIRAVMMAHVPGLLPPDMAARVSLLDRFPDPGIGPFDRCRDLFGDGSVRLIPLPGHAIGQFGTLLQTGPQQRKLLIADAVWTSSSWRERRLPHPITRFINTNHRQYVDTIDRIRAFAAQFPDVEIIPTHCPEVQQRYQHDAHRLAAASGRVAL
jgi:2-alkyl-3-oxoalkanoate reductase